MSESATERRAEHGPLETLIHLISAKASGHGDEALAGVLMQISDDHQPTDRGDCAMCGLGDITWPCGPWMGALRVAVKWVFVEIGDS